MLNRCICCGIIEVDEIRGQRAETNLKYIWDELEYGVDFCGEDRGAYIMFTDHCDLRYGRALERMIKKLRLGKVHRLPSRYNHNSGNRIQVWMWAYNYKKFRALARKKKWDTIQDDIPDAYNYGHTYSGDITL